MYVQTPYRMGPVWRKTVEQIEHLTAAARFLDR